MRTLLLLPVYLLACWFLTTTKSIAGPSDVPLRANDVIRLEVFNEADLNATAKIMRSGDVVLQFVGPVKIAGLSIAEATEKIRALYDKDYLVDPKVTLTIEAYAQDVISVTGSVTGGGQFPFPPNGKLNLAAALAMAGGVTRDADPQGVTVTSAGGGSATYSKDATVPIQPGDQITVKRSAFADQVVQVNGQVRRPGAVPFPANGRLTLIDAISQAGNCTELANPKKVKINRQGEVTEINLKEMIEKGSKSYPLRPNDMIIVPDRIW
ncbi:polysaccharide biosynthesis/export family protein [Haloferula sp. BvORR071]|uniref:polysaccharide biosynthesis/export family protein n=1 Tax=Haloferula sp. BvORR071 TaxID=1396141 RepID=UPI0005527204|nr:polysaccharide biosynthesis/export family protein [Haloferula sp. BvORR071]